MEPALVPALRARIARLFHAIRAPWQVHLDGSGMATDNMARWADVRTTLDARNDLMLQRENDRWRQDKKGECASDVRMAL